MATILVLDDVLDAVTLLRRILEKKGFQVFGFLAFLNLKVL